MASAELFEDPFDPVEYVERLAWRTPGGGTKGGAQSFNPQMLYEEFVAHIEELKSLDDRIHRKAERLDKTLQKESRMHKEKVYELQKSNQNAFTQFQALDDRISYVATKVVHLGDQLEGVNTPRAHAVEAHELMQYFDEFLSGEIKSPVLLNQNKVTQAADIVQKLHLIAQELPYNKFAAVKSRITTKYHQIEEELLQEFTEAHKSQDYQKMAEHAATLSHFKGYQHCIEAFINESLKNLYYKNSDIFHEVFNLCTNVSKVISQVFSSPEQVMGKLISKIYHEQLQQHIHAKLRESKNTDPEKYLQNLFTLYSKTNELSRQLTGFKLGSDSNFLTKLTMGIFRPFLDSYIEVEIGFLKEKASMISQRFYDSKNHTKKQFSGSGVSNLKAVISDKTSIRFGISIGSNTPENHNGETFLSQELAINLLQETKMAFNRCTTLSVNSANLASNAVHIFDLLVENLCSQHINYAIELGMECIPNADPRTEPDNYFLDVVQQTNTIFHLFEKQFSDTLLPLISSSPKYGECIQKKKLIREQMEVRLDTGIDKSLSSIVGWMRNTLKNEQKKNDFATDTPTELQCTLACKHVCTYMQEIVRSIYTSLDGENVTAVLTEFGTRFHRLLYEHLQMYTFTSMGAMMVICDINEYKKCAGKLHIPFVTNLFESLHALCNLLVVAPENLRQVCVGEQLANLDRAILHSFVQLRSDYRAAKLAKLFA